MTVSGGVETVSRTDVDIQLTIYDVVTGESVAQQRFLGAHGACPSSIWVDGTMRDSVTVRPEPETMSLWLHSFAQPPPAD